MSNATTSLLQSIREEQARHVAQLTKAMREVEGAPRVQVVEVRRCAIAALHQTERMINNPK